MKKIIAILLALAMVSMAFAQYVSVSNTLSTDPYVIVDGGKTNWGFNTATLRDQVDGSGTTADGRATIQARVRLHLDWVDRMANESILSVKPRWKFSTNEFQAGATLRPFNNFELFIGHAEMGARGVPGVPNYSGWWLQGGDYAYGGWGNQIQIRNLAGGWQATHGLETGVYAAFTGVDKLWFAAGIVTSASPTNNKDSTWIKKGAYGPFQAAVAYNGDQFGVGAKWHGQFGGYNASATDNQGKGDTDKRYQYHTFYVGADLKFLQDAKVGTTFQVGVAFNTERASQIMDTKKNTSVAGSVKASFDFRNSITDWVSLTVGYNQYDGKRSKVLPFCIQNNLGYKVSDDASFSLFAAYAQGALTNKVKTYTNGIVGVDPNLGTASAYTGKFACIIAVKPEFSFKLGNNTFTVGVATDVFNDMQHYAKTDRDWSYTAIRGISARVTLPLSWKYTF